MGEGREVARLKATDHVCAIVHLSASVTDFFKMGSISNELRAGLPSFWALPKPFTASTNQVTARSGGILLVLITRSKAWMASQGI